MPEEKERKDQRVVIGLSARQVEELDRFCQERNISRCAAGRRALRFIGAISEQGRPDMRAARPR